MKKLLRVLPVLLLSSSVAFADVVVTLQSGDGQGEMLISGQKLAMKTAGRGEQVVIRGDQGYMMTVDPGKKAVTKITKENMKQLGNQVNAAMKNFEAQLANVPPQQAEAMKKLMGGMMAKMSQPQQSPPVVSKTGQKRTVAEYTCEEYEVSRDGEVTRRYCVVPSSEISGGSEVRAGLQVMGDFFRELLTATQQGPFAKVIENPYLEFSKIGDGVPVLTEEVKGGQVVRSTTITSIKNDKIEVARFEPPTGYAVQNFGAGIGNPMGGGMPFRVPPQQR
ncbi:MAG: hypothetical protein KDD70_05395 [Bdellovibrionales bacterium]|nr:hypothetical protein [Bdellovibrionales bacterium]